ncbi:serine/threonine-protein kinase [Pseudomonas entomophila]|uniref:serine/threonine-protein kinase n=1 Tax=Pseudomonas entomophila TaxID=312306 RepID=UPI0023D89CE6|nr:serine/threonine-protein kinase [Pseudomonas entomophila]MDF0732400.1 serine/threonine-protein kinase [Pseudomonas entomophila]
MLERLGKYRIDSVLGKGAMGTVYKAFDPHIARVVALKTIRRELLGDGQQQQLLSRFQNEAQAAGRLSHPNIVAVYDYGEDDGAAYIAMEFVDGIALNTRLQNQEPRQLAQVLGWMRQLLGALHYAHAKGVVHRDVKPANLLITSDDQVKVTDFGIARIDTSVLTQTGSMIGTPSYMSPEQFCGELVDGRSDVFSAGIVLYQLLTGERPFSGSATMVMQQILNQTPVPPSSLNPTLDPQFDALIRQALAKRPDERFASAQDFLEALEALSGPQTLGSVELDDDRTRLLMPASFSHASLGSAPTAGSDAADTLIPWKRQVRPQLESLLSQQIGPLARLLVKRSLAGADDFASLRSALLPHIPSERGREQFVAATEALLASSEAPPTDHSPPSQTPMPAELDAAFVQASETRLTYLIGPIARIVLRRALPHASTRQALLHALAEHIPDPAQRIAFLEEQP